MKTNFMMLSALVNDFRPAQMGFISGEEVQTVRVALELAGRSELDLRNLRDMTVMFFDVMQNHQRERGNVEEAWRLADVSSAVVAVIDDQIWNIRK